MKGQGGLWAHMPSLAGREQEDALRLLEESQRFLLYILAGVALQYKSLDLERQKLLGQGCVDIEPRNMQQAASLITLGALFGFQGQAERLAARTAQAGGVPDEMDVKLGAVSILVSIIRLFRLMTPEPEPNPQAQAAQDLEQLTEPAI